MDKIYVEKADREFASRILDTGGGLHALSCFTCKTCVGSCPVTEVNPEFNPLKIIRSALLGLKEEVLNSSILWLCTGCYSCQERCPMGVRITDMLTRLKDMAAKEGMAPTGIKAQLDLIKGNGRIYPLDDFDNKKRQKADLPPIPTTCVVVKELFPES